MGLLNSRFVAGKAILTRVPPVFELEAIPGKCPACEREWAIIGATLRQVKALWMSQVFRCATCGTRFRLKPFMFPEGVERGARW